MESETVVGTKVRQTVDRAYKEHAATVYRYAWSRCHSDELAADVVQDVFVHLLRALPRLDLTRPLLPWLLVVAHRRACDACAAAARCGELRGADAVAPGFAGDEAAHLRASPAALLAALAPVEREVVYRRVFLEQSFAQIADQLRCTPGACRMKYTRACATLRQLATFNLVLLCVAASASL